MPLCSEVIGLEFPHVESSARLATTKLRARIFGESSWITSSANPTRDLTKAVEAKQLSGAIRKGQRPCSDAIDSFT